MATLAVQIVTEEIEKVANENGSCEIHSKIAVEELSADTSENIRPNLTNENFADSGISTCKSDSDTSVLTSKGGNDEKLSNADSNQGTHLGKDLNISQHSKEQTKFNIDCYSQESKQSNYNFKETFKETQTTQNSNTGSSSILNSSQIINNDDDNSCSSISSSASTIKISQSTFDELNDNINSSSQNSRKNTSPKNQSHENEKTLNKDKNLDTNLVQDNESCSSFTSSFSRSLTKGSQLQISNSDEESKSRSSFQSESQCSSTKQGENGDVYKRSQSVKTDISEDSNAHSLISRSNTECAIKNNQFRITQSDDESNSGYDLKSSKNNSPVKKNEVEINQPKKYLSIVDSDSEDEIIARPKKLSKNERNTGFDTKVFKRDKSSDLEKKSIIKNKRKMLDSDSDEELATLAKASKESPSNSEIDSNNSLNDGSKSINKSNRISNIVDSDSESGSDNQNESKNFSSCEENDPENNKQRKKSEKKRTGSARASKDLAMQQIHSETQRLIRESSLSLPYHKPKQRTLQEFLNRKKLTSTIPKNLTCAEKVKMFSEVISKVVKEKEKEAEIFYKSSDSEDDKENNETILAVDQVNIKHDNKNEILPENIDTSDAINIGDTQKLTQDSIQDCHNKREILQQRSLDFGVPRKLFMEDAIQMEETEHTQASKENQDENFNSDGILAIKKKIKEVKSGLRESSIPRKLFSEDIEEMDTEVEDNKSSTCTSEGMDNHISKTSETAEKNLENCETATELENSTEDFVLNMSETELDVSDDKKLKETSKTSESSIPNIIENQENIMIAETPFLSHKDLPRSNRLSISHSKDQSTIENDLPNTEKSKELDESILKLSKEGDEIIDKNVLRDDFGLPPEFDEPVKKLNRRQQILARALKTRPIIKASPGSIIEFTDSAEMKEGVTKLLDRFARHSAVTKPNADKIAEVKIVRTEGVGDDIQLIEEILPFNKTIVDDDSTKESKPGEKLQKLKEDLRQKIASARNEEWKQKKEYEKEEGEEETKCKGDDFYEGLPDEEELLEDEESGESEPEENDILIIDKKRSKCEFGDEEAEESETEDVDETDAVNEDDEKKTDDGEQEDEEEDQEEDDDEDEVEDEDEDEIDDEDEESNDANEYNYKPKKLKRIIRPVEDNSSDSDSNSSNFIIEKLSFESAKEDEDIFASQTSNDNMEIDVIPPFQIRDRCGSDSRSQSCKTPLPKSNNILSMISPVAQLTVLNTSLDSAKKSASKMEAFEFSQISASNTPSDNSDRPQTTCNMEKMINLQKKLFEDTPESVNDEEILAICSGKFDQTQFTERFGRNIRNDVTDSQIMDVCSGAFVTQADGLKKLNANKSKVNYADGVLKTSGKCAQNEVTDSQIMDVCSGAFVTQPAADVKQTEVNNSRSNDDDKTLKLFKKDAQNEVTDSQIMDVCSGAFVTQPAAALKQTEVNNSRPNGEDKTLKLFKKDAQNEVTDSQIMDVCSGAFDTQPAVDVKQTEVNNSRPNDEDRTLKLFKKDAQNEVTNSQIMDLCSGPFFSQLPSMKKPEASNTNVQVNDESSQDIILTLEDEEVSSPLQTTASVKRSDESMFSSDSKSPVNKPFSFSNLTSKNPMEAWLKNANEKSATGHMPQKSNVSDSQLLELCSGPFLSQPVDLKELENDKASEIQKKKDEDLKHTVKKDKKDSKTKKHESSTKEEESQQLAYRIVSSDEDDNPDVKKAQRKKKALKKKKVQILQLSDDEDASPNEFPDEEESEIEEEEEQEEQYVDYDSDENEVIVVPKKEIKKVAANFLENEAELSESEWGSADEDEHDLDKLEAEEGDAENIDEAKMKNELDRIHMKQIMDEDQREVRMLQELLFDDGDLHSEGAGRERKFKWKNIDSLGDITLERTDDNGDLIDEEIDPEMESQMRKMRYEQQKFLEETEKDAEKRLSDDFNESGLTNFGLKVVSVRSSTKLSTTEQKIGKAHSVATANLTITNRSSSLAKKTGIGAKSFSISNVRGSFLSRGEDALVRIAQHLPKTSSEPVSAAGKRKFVFQHLSPSVATEVQDNNEDDSDNTPDKDAQKNRKRRIFSSQTPRTTKKLKVDDRAPGKKLF